MGFFSKITPVLIVYQVPHAVECLDDSSPRQNKPKVSVPSRVVFAALTIAPWIRNGGQSIGLEVSSDSALAAGLVMGMMIIPFISSLSDDVVNAVPQSLRDGAHVLGATKSEIIKQVIIPAALPGCAR